MKAWNQKSPALSTIAFHINDFYEFLGLEKTKLGDAVGWSSCNGDIYWIDFNHHRLTLDDGMEIYVIDMVFEPTAEWMEDL